MVEEGEEAVPVDSAVTGGPLVVLVAGVRETPGYQGPVLLVARVALALPVSTSTDSSLGPGTAPALLDVVVLVDQLLGVAAVLQLDNLVGKISPVRTGRGGDQLEPGLRDFHQ